LLLLTVGSGAGYYIYHRAQTDRELAELLAALDRDDSGWRQFDLDVKRLAEVPAEKNSAPVILKLHRQLPAGWEKEDPDEDWRDLPPGEPLPDKQAAILVKRLRALEELLPPLRRLTDLPEGRFTIGWTPDVIGTTMQHVHDVRELADLLRQDVYVLAHRRDLNGAIVSCRAIVQVGRSLDDEPSVISQLARSGCLELAVQSLQHTLASGDVDEVLLAKVQKALEDAARQDAFLVGMRGERAGMHELFTNVEDGTVPLGLLLAVLGQRSSGSFVVADRAQEMAVAPTVRSSHLWMMRHLNGVIEAHRMPAAEQDARMKQVDAEKDSAPLLAKQLMPGWSRFHATFRQRQARLGCAIIAAAVERYRMKHDRWPAELDAVVPGLLAKLPADPYTGAAFKYRRMGGDVVIFSGGPDGTHHGDYYDRVPPQFPLAGLPAGTLPGSNYEFRLWDPARRGLSLAERLK
jgi:hypothetical protein